MPDNVITLVKKNAESLKNDQVCGNLSVKVLRYNVKFYFQLGELEFCQASITEIIHNLKVDLSSRHHTSQCAFSVIETFVQKLSKNFAAFCLEVKKSSVNGMCLLFIFRG